MAAIGMAALVLDPSPDPLEIPPPESEWEPQPYEVHRHVARLAGRPLERAPRMMIDGMLRALDPDPSGRSPRCGYANRSTSIA
jgi:hypothetical protein